MKSFKPNLFAKILLVILIISALFFAWKSDQMSEARRRLIEATGAFNVVIFPVVSQSLTTLQERQLAFFTFSSAIATIMSIFATIAVEFSSRKHWGGSHFVKVCIYRALVFVIIFGFVLGIIALALIFNNRAVPFLVSLINITWHIFLFIFCTKLMLVYCTPIAAAHIIYYWAAFDIHSKPHKPDFDSTYDCSPDKLSENDKKVLRLIACPLLYLSRILPCITHKFNVGSANKAILAIMKSNPIVDNQYSILGLSIMREIAYEVVYYRTANIVKLLKNTESELISKEEAITKEKESVFITGSIIGAEIAELITKSPQLFLKGTDKFFEQLKKIIWSSIDPNNKEMVHSLKYFFYLGMSMEILSMFIISSNEVLRNSLADAILQIFLISDLDNGYRDIDRLTSTSLRVAISVICQLMDGDKALEQENVILKAKLITEEADIDRLASEKNQSAFSAKAPNFFIQKILENFNGQTDAFKKSLHALIKAASDLSDTTDPRVKKLRDLLTGKVFPEEEGEFCA